MAAKNQHVAAWTMIALVALLVVPVGAAQGTLMDPFAIAATLSIPSDLSTVQDELFLISGALHLERDVRGLVVAAKDQGSLFQVGRVEVYDLRDPEAFARQQPVLRADNATMTPDAGASFGWSFPRAAVTASAAHTVGLLVDVESQLNDMGPLVPKRQGGPLPHLVVDGRASSWEFSASVGRGVYFPLEGGFHVTGGNVDRTFSGTHWIALLTVDTAARLDAVGLAVPTDSELIIEFTRASDAAFTARFTTTRVNEFISAAFELADLVASMDGPPEYTPPTCVQDPASCLPAVPPGAPGAAFDGLEAVIPRLLAGPTEGRDATAGGAWVGPVASGQAGGRAVEDQHEGGADAPQEGPRFALPPGLIEGAGSSLNGAVVGQIVGTVTRGSETTEEPALAILRFTTLGVSGFKTGEATMSGSSPFAYAGGDAYHKQNLLAFSYFIVPFLSIFLFVGAAVLWVIARGKNRDHDEDTKGDAWSRAALATRIALWVLALVLFDRELYHIFGESVLGTIGFWGGAGFTWKGLGFILLVESLVWSYASFLFGLPIKVGGKALLRIGHFSKRLGGFPAGLGALIAFLLGVGLIRPILGVVLASVEAAL